MGVKNAGIQNKDSYDGRSLTMKKEYDSYLVLSEENAFERYHFIGPLKGLADRIREKTKRYKVMYRHYFPSQDGYDYIDHEVSGELHVTREQAREELNSYQDNLQFAGETFWIKEVEV